MLEFGIELTGVKMLEISHLNKSYGGKCILNDINLRVNQSEIVCILGKSGAGKTTLLRMIAGIESPDQGHLKNHFKRMAYVFQEDRLLPWLTAKDNIALVNDNLSDQAINTYLEMMSLTDSGDKMPDELSGGMRQRVSIARAYAYQPHLLLMDEPFKSVDIKLKKAMIESLLDLWQTYHNAIIMVTHDIEEALKMADRIILVGGNPTRIVKEIVVTTPRKMTVEAKAIMTKEVMEEI